MEYSIVMYMKLTKAQVQEIEKFLDFKELTHLDLRNEVLDHMITSIENTMHTEALDFKAAFSLEVHSWQKELSNYASFWLGMLWSGPQIVVRKCVRQVKRIYANAILIAMLLTGLLYTLKTIAKIDFLAQAQNIIGTTYLFFIVAAVFLHFKIKSTGYTTSYSFLFKINAIGIGLMYLVCNPIWIDIMQIHANNEIVGVNLLFHSFSIVFSFSLLSLFKLHKNALKIGAV